MEHYVIGNESISLLDLKAILDSGKPLRTDPAAMQKVQACRDFLDQHMEKGADPVYGVNTGFGSLCDTVISSDKLSQLQENLVKSHACGTGAEISPAIVKLMLLLKIKGLLHGHSGVQCETIERLVLMYNCNALPIVYEQGSLGASGDLAPLAHMSLPLLGLGEINASGSRISGEDWLNQMGLEPLTLRSKEGLALLNGTQFMSAFAVWCWLRSAQLCENADLIAALSLDAFHGRPEPFHPLIHEIRPHPGQKSVAANMLNYLANSSIQAIPKKHVQDPYSFRCLPQVHGATRDVLVFIRQVLEREINAVTDNPTIFPEQQLIISAGNFHGQPLALALDQLAIAVAELGSISERRTYKLIGGTRGLPAFLVANPGLNSGFMIPQYTAASIVSRNKQLCTPASVDTIDSSNGQEDHVSMGANAAVKARQVVMNVTQILGIELMNGAQALDLRRPHQSSKIIERLHAAFRTKVPFIEEDVVMYPLMHAAGRFVAMMKPSQFNEA
jgi:histidine ammonia-lyase